MEIAKKKAETVAERHDDAIIIAADTMIYFDGKQIGQQETAEEALELMQNLCGQTHEVHSGICVMNTTNGSVLIEHDISHVTLKCVSDETIKRSKSYSVYLRPSSANEIIGQKNYAPHNFEVTADYVYEIKKEKTVYVKSKEVVEV